jgi:putative Holliday junction resolvase
VIAVPREPRRIRRRASRYTRGVTRSPTDLSSGLHSSILAIDYGRARIGLALADSETRMPQPLSTLERINRNEDIRRLRELVREHGVKQIVVGLPLRLDGTRGEMAEEVEGFAQRLRKQIGVRVEMVDERLTSWEAERLLEELQGRFIRDDKLPGGRKSKKAEAKMTVDAVAAAVILKEYLERQGQAREHEKA